MPDFANYQTLPSVRALAGEGKLVKLLLFPAEFGGEDVPHNVVYVTMAAADAHAAIVGTLRRMVREGLLDRMEVTPVWRDKSFVPAGIRFHAWHTAKAGTFEPEIVVW
jgi:hypothetical protein